MKKIKSFWKFEIKGLNQERFINNISKKFKIFDYNRENKEYASFKVNYLSGKKVENELKESGFEILSIEKRGIYIFFNRTISYGLLLGLVLGFTGYFVQSLFVRKIEVWGNEKLKEKEIVEVVKKKIGNGYKGSIQTKQIENAVYSSFSNLSFVSVAIIGQTVVVNIKEEIIPDEMAESFDAFYSPYDGKITKIELIQGTLAVKVGDIVKSGDMLVYPYIQNSNNVNMPVKPIAKIEMESWIQGIEAHNSFYKENYRTGRQTTENEVYLGKLTLYHQQASGTFSNFETETSVKELNKNNILPLTLKTTTYYEIKERVVEESFEQVKENIILKAKENALQKVDNCDIIKSEDYVIRQSGNITTVTYIFTVTKIIGG